MTDLIELFPNAQKRRWVELEAAFEAVEAQPGTFTVRDIQQRAGYHAAVSVINELKGLGLVERLNGKEKPAIYRVKPEAIKESTR